MAVCDLYSHYRNTQRSDQHWRGPFPSALQRSRRSAGVFLDVNGIVPTDLDDPARETSDGARGEKAGEPNVVRSADSTFVGQIELRNSECDVSKAADR